MKTINELNDISDGRLYDIRDMVKADAGGCEACSACCEGVGDLVELTPFDVYEIKKHLNISYDDLLNDRLELYEESKVLLPHLAMKSDESCVFLNTEGRCSIHGARPDICRLFPLGRVYDDKGFQYFLQKDACLKEKLAKVKVKKWIGIKDYNMNKTFIYEWYKFKKALFFRLKFVRDDEELKRINTLIQDTFFRATPDNFYEDFLEKLPKIKNELGII